MTNSEHIRHQNSLQLLHRYSTSNTISVWCQFGATSHRTCVHTIPSGINNLILFLKPEYNLKQNTYQQKVQFKVPDLIKWWLTLLIDSSAKRGPTDYCHCYSSWIFHSQILHRQKKLTNCCQGFIFLSAVMFVLRAKTSFPLRASRSFSISARVKAKYLI